MNVDAKSDALGQRSNSIIKLFAIGWALFAAASIGVREIGERFFPDVLAAHPGLSNFLLKSLLIIVAFFMATRGGGLVVYGFRRPAPNFRWLPLAMLGAIPGALSTVLILATPAKGLANLAGIGLPGLIIFVWLYSSIAEEIYVRGWLQTGFGSGQAAIFASALFFGSMHLSLLWTATDYWTVVIVVTVTTMLGAICARLRDASKSLLPPVVAHVAFNVGGFVAAILISIASILISGHPIKP